MNNKIIGGIVVVILIAAGVYFLTQNKNDQQSGVASDNATTETASPANAEALSMKSLLTKQGNQTCTFKDSTTAEQATEGTVFVSQGKMRGDFSVKSSAQTNVSHMIVNGSDAYVWADGSGTGIKVTFDAIQSNNLSNKALDPNKNLDFSCSNWSVDQSKFEIPSTVRFETVPVPTGASATNSGASSANVCASLPEPAKTQCEAALKR